MPALRAFCFTVSNRAAPVGLQVLVIADEAASPVFIAADLLSQAEHGPDSQVRGSRRF